MVDALKSGKVKSAALDVLEYEKSSLENLDTSTSLNKETKKILQFLLESNQVIVTPTLQVGRIKARKNWRNLS